MTHDCSAIGAQQAVFPQFSNSDDYFGGERLPFPTEGFTTGLESRPQRRRRRSTKSEAEVERCFHWQDLTAVAQNFGEGEE